MLAISPRKVRLSVYVVFAALSLSVAACGSTPVPSATTPVSEESSDGGAGEELFDSSTVHEISISLAQEDYDAMIQAYKESETKEWIEATVTIDGKVYARAGIRLKGNSSLRGLANGRGMGTAGAISAADPQGLPWLIRLDKYVEGQNHDGIFELAVRSNNSSTALNEAVSLDLLEMAGLASQDAIAVSFSINDSAARLRLVTEHPDDRWMAENLDIGGALYKAESTGDYSYRGADPDLYDEVFDQEAGKANADLTPLIEFLDFLNNSDDAAFKEDLPERLDIDSFATYLAMEELIGNFDDIDGPGNNSYLYYDPDTKMFTVVPWDHNLTFGVMNQGAPGGAGPRGQGGAEGLPAGEVQTAERLPAGGGREQGPNSMRNKSNVLVERFHADADFETLYQEKLADLRETLYASGAAADVLAQWTALLKSQASDLVSAATVDQEAAKISAFFSAG